MKCYNAYWQHILYVQVGDSTINATDVQDKLVVALLMVALIYTRFNKHKEHVNSSNPKGN